MSHSQREKCTQSLQVLPGGNGMPPSSFVGSLLTNSFFLEATPLQWQWRKESPSTLKNRNIRC
jgi:hypothetical protein